MTERRNHKRAFFLLENDVPIILSSPKDPGKKINGNLLSISQGGFGFVAKRHELKNITVCDHVMVDSIKLPEPVRQIENFEIEIRYFVDFNTFARIAVGCMFLDLPNQIKERIKDLVDKKSQVLKE